MNAQATHTANTDYHSYLAAGRQMRSAAIREFLGLVFDLPHQLLTSMTRRADRSARANASAFSSAGC
jgi:hypothetical protein